MDVDIQKKIGLELGKITISLNEIIISLGESVSQASYSSYSENLLAREDFYKLFTKKAKTGNELKKESVKTTQDIYIHNSKDQKNNDITKMNEFLKANFDT